MDRRYRVNWVNSRTDIDMGHAEFDSLKDAFKFYSELLQDKHEDAYLCDNVTGLQISGYLTPESLDILAMMNDDEKNISDDENIISIKDKLVEEFTAAILSIYGDRAYKDYSKDEVSKEDIQMIAEKVSWYLDL